VVAPALYGGVSRIAKAHEGRLPAQEMMNMANQGKQGGPPHEAQVKGGQHSHQGSESGSAKSGTNKQSSREESSKGGQQSHSGSGKK
jgi:hypothetical protein